MKTSITLICAFACILLVVFGLGKMVASILWNFNIGGIVLGYVMIKVSMAIGEKYETKYGEKLFE